MVTRFSVEEIMSSKKHYDHKARDAAPPGENQKPKPKDQHPVNPETQEDTLILLAQQIEAKRNPSRYLEGWIRRFVRG